MRRTTSVPWARPALEHVDAADLLDERHLSTLRPSSSFVMPGSSSSGSASPARG